MIRTDIKGLIFDLDNTLYPLPAEKDKIFSHGVAVSAIKLGFPGTYEDALATAQKSWALHRSELVLFCQDYGLSEQALIRAYHAESVHSMVERVQPCNNLRTAFNQLAQTHDMLVLTHGTQSWAETLLAHLGFAQAIKTANRILGIDHELTSFRKKNDGPENFKLSADLMALQAHQIAVVEDTIENLVHPDQMGMQTIYVHWGKPLDELPRHVHMQVKSIADLTPR